MKEIIANISAKAEQGKDITIVAFGGSITQGMLASTVDNRWLNLTGQWLKRKFYRSKITVVNLGIGATGSNIGVFRFNSEIREYKPDIIFVEFSVNDVGIDNAAETFEGLIRKILKYPGSPAIFVVVTCDSLLRNCEEVHLPVIKYYHLPMASMKKVLAKNSNVDNPKIFFDADGIHPNDKGHKLIADLIINYMEQALNKSEYIPKPLRSDMYENTQLLNAENTKPLKNEGWKIAGLKGILYGQWWESSSPGNILEIETAECRGTGILAHAYSSAKISIDGEISKEINASQGKGPIIMEPVFMISTDLDCKKHKIKIVSTKAGFIVKAILLSGVKNIHKSEFLKIPNSVTIYY
ncbi:MAG: SGNH/GDSL hydrolase family protein [Candidatus Omnitrophota bacterium]